MRPRATPVLGGPTLRVGSSPLPPGLVAQASRLCLPRLHSLPAIIGLVAAMLALWAATSLASRQPEQPASPRAQEALPPAPSLREGEPAQPGQEPTKDAGVPGWAVPRLLALEPTTPDAYFNLAEELADAAREPAEFDLARRLYAMAYELSRKRDPNSPLAASACLGLATAKLARLDADRRWLAALAATIDPKYGRIDWNVAAAAGPSDELALKAAILMGMARAGEGRRAADMLADPGVRGLLASYERAIGTTGQAGAIFRLEKAIQQWPCPECGNSRVVTRQGEKGPEVRLCPVCQGNPGPKLTDAELIAQLRFEAGLLNGIQRSWASQLAVDQSAPLRDPEPDDLAAMFGADLTKPYWRAGAWTADGSR